MEGSETNIHIRRDDDRSENQEIPLNEISGFDQNSVSTVEPTSSSLNEDHDSTSCLDFPTANNMKRSQERRGESKEQSVLRNSKVAKPDEEETLGSSNLRRNKTRKNVLRSYPMLQTKNPSLDAKSGRVISKLKNLYKTHVLPIERKYDLYSIKGSLPTKGEIRDAEFDARPMVLLLGQYSTGKTSFIRYLVGGDFPGMHIGPEPTTDRFVALVHGSEEQEEGDYAFEHDTAKCQTGGPKDGQNTSKTGKIIKGNSLTVTPELPFASLSSFGSAFLSHFEGSVSSAPILNHITLIDTPGVLSGEKQRIARTYDFSQAVKWFADRSDLILLLFDAHKLDVSDELKEVVETIQPHNSDKIRCVLNKADGVTKEQMVRVYGSLMWSMGKIFPSPEVVRVYTGSYWDEPFAHDDFEAMFESDECMLIHELMNLPKTLAERKVNDMVKRIRLVKVHVCIMGHLRKVVPKWFGRKHAQDKLIAELGQVFKTVRMEYKLSEGDMPKLDDFAAYLRTVEDFSVFPSVLPKILHQLDELIIKEIPEVMKGSVGITGTPASAKEIKMGASTRHTFGKYNLLRGISKHLNGGGKDGHSRDENAEANETAPTSTKASATKSGVKRTFTSAFT